MAARLDDRRIRLGPPYTSDIGRSVNVISSTSTVSLSVNPWIAVSSRSRSAPTRHACLLPCSASRADANAVLTEETRRNHDPLDLIRALEDLGNAGIPEGTLDGIVPRVAEAPVDLEGRVDGA